MDSVNLVVTIVHGRRKGRPDDITSGAARPHQAGTDAAFRFGLDRRYGAGATLKSVALAFKPRGPSPLGFTGIAVQHLGRQ